MEAGQLYPTIAILTSTNYGLSSDYISWFNSFSTNREASVSISGILSRVYGTWQPITQVLGPNEGVYWANELQKYHTTKCNTHFRIFFYFQLVILGRWLLTWLTWFLPGLPLSIAVCQLTLLKLKVKVILGPTVSLGVKHPSRAYDKIFIIVRQLRVCWCGALSLTREWVCRLQLLLVLASAVILGSESLGIRHHILLSQIRDSPNLEG
jgi:hypothetical protein